MTITVDLSPEARSELERQAAARGRAVEAYAASLLEQAIHVSTVAADPASSRNLQELFESVRGLADDVDFSRKPSVGRPIDLS